MKYLIKFITIIILINLTLPSAQAQSVVFKYDAAGNMVKRSVQPCAANQPNAPGVQNISERTAFLFWERGITGFEFTKYGENDWKKSTHPQPGVILSGLDPCQKYTTRLSYTCAGETLYSPETSFTTKGCTTCSVADMEIFINPGGTATTVVWDVYPGANYIFNYRIAGESNFRTYTTVMPLVILLGLEPCTTYEFALQVDCGGGQISEVSKPQPYATGCRLGQANEAPTVQIHPNPASRYINIAIGGEKTAQQLEIYSSNGQLVKQLQPQEGISTYQLDVSGFTKGIYLMKAQLGDEVVIEKFSVQ